MMAPARVLAGLAAALILAACEPAEMPAAPTPAPPAPEAPALSETDRQAQLREARAERNRAANRAAILASAQASDASRAQRDYYARMERSLLAQGRLRRDRDPADASFDSEMLVRNFVRIALRDEYSRRDGALLAKESSAPLRRWAEPVLFQPEFGASIDLGRQRAWRAEIADYASRLAEASGHPVRLDPQDGNVLVLILSEDERRSFGPRLLELVPGIPPEDVAILTDLPPSITCTVFAYSEDASPVYARAVAVIRAELPPLLRQSCIHEELAQAMGLVNDSPDARPSIFNDDEEFALLTRHDELLLRMLYDPRLRPGMTEDEALPILHRIAAELLASPI